MRIIDLTPENSRAVEQAAMLLVDGFRDTGSISWSNLEEALSEVREFFQPGRISRAAVDEAGNVQGWIGGIGIIPDANGFGKPDILMAKRISSRGERST